MVGDTRVSPVRRTDDGPHSPDVPPSWKEVVRSRNGVVLLPSYYCPHYYYPWCFRPRCPSEPPTRRHGRSTARRGPGPCSPTRHGPISSVRNEMSRIRTRTQESPGFTAEWKSIYRCQPSFGDPTPCRRDSMFRNPSRPVSPTRAFRPVHG